MPSVSRRVYLRAYRAWIEADRRWELALREARQLVPSAKTRLSWSIGNRGSRMRALYEARSRAMVALYNARAAYHADHPDRHPRPGAIRLRLTFHHGD